MLPRAYPETATNPDKLVEDHYDLARKNRVHVHGRVGKRVEIDDLLQVAYLGLLDAARRYVRQAQHAPSRPMPVFVFAGRVMGPFAGRFGRMTRGIFALASAVASGRTAAGAIAAAQPYGNGNRGRGLT